ncbi:MAG: AraC family transcriptional regulator [Spirochaetes bacterium]|nr:AraC family transcriptional regulator [Spirochaetota bacterium]
MKESDPVEPVLRGLLASCLVLDDEALSQRNRELLTFGPRLAFTEKGRELGCFLQVRRPTAATAFEDHTHDFFEISFILDGEAKHKSGEHVYPVRRGDLFLLNHQSPHRFIVPKGRALTILNIHFLPEFLESTVTFEKLEAGLQFFLFEPFFRSVDDASGKLAFEGAEFARLAAHALLMLDEFNRAWPKKSELLPPLFKAFITLVTRAYAQRCARRPGWSRHQEEVFRGILAFIEARHTGPIRVSEIGSAVGLGRTRLAELFRERQGTSIVDYVRRKRVEHAQQLLRGTDLTILEIALESGFGDVSNFNRTFRSLLGTTPRAFRAGASAKISGRTA